MKTFFTLILLLDTICAYNIGFFRPKRSLRQTRVNPLQGKSFRGTGLIGGIGNGGGGNNGDNEQDDFEGKEAKAGLAIVMLFTKGFETYSNLLNIHPYTTKVLNISHSLQTSFIQIFILFF